MLYFHFSSIWDKMHNIVSLCSTIFQGVQGSCPPNTTKRVQKEHVDYLPFPLKFHANDTLKKRKRTSQIFCLELMFFEPRLRFCGRSFCDEFVGEVVQSLTFESLPLLGVFAFIGWVERARQTFWQQELNLLFEFKKASIIFLQNTSFLSTS